MLKYLFLIISVCSIGYYAWSELADPNPVVVEDFNDDEMLRQQNMKDKNLHKAFEQILDQNSANQEHQRHPASDAFMPDANQESDNDYDNPADVPPAQRREIIMTLQHEISSNEKAIMSLKASGEYDSVEKLEERLQQKKERLETYQSIDAQSGDDLENN